MIYLGGPYTSKTIDQHRLNVGKFMAYQTYLYHTMKEHTTIICVPLMTSGYDYTPISIQPENWLNICLHAIPYCQIGYFVPGFDRSSGSVAEINKLQQYIIPWYSLDLFDLEEREILRGLLKPMTQYNPIAFWALDWLTTLTGCKLGTFCYDSIKY